MPRRPTIDPDDLGTMRREAARVDVCPTCGESAGKTTQRTRDAHGEVIVVRCVGCGATLAPR